MNALRLINPRSAASSVWLYQCRLADRDHERERRVYAHVLHYPHRICIASAFNALPENHQLGILLHEFGHLHLRDQVHTEEDADRMGGDISGVKIYRRLTSAYGNDLEYVRDLARARAFVNRHLARHI